MTWLVRKNSRERIALDLGEYAGREVFAARVSYLGEAGEWLPSPKGLVFAVERLPAFAEAVGAALAEARRRGLIHEEGEE